MFNSNFDPLAELERAHSNITFLLKFVEQQHNQINNLIHTIDLLEKHQRLLKLANEHTAFRLDEIEQRVLRNEVKTGQC